MSANYNTSRFEAVVDWIEFEIQPTRATDFKAVQKALLKTLGKTLQVTPFRQPSSYMVNPYAQYPEDEFIETRYAQTFTFRLQDVRRYLDIENTLKGLSLALGCEISTRPTAIEVSFDAYNSNAEQAARFFKFGTNSISDNQRLYRRGKSAGDITQRVPSRLETLTARLRDGWKIGTGNATDDRYQRIYFKTTDGGEPLPPSDHRARIEITLQGNALPFTTLEELKRFKFGSLAQFFKFKQIKPNLTPPELHTVNIAAQIGGRKARRGKNGGTYLFSGLVQADKELNDMAKHRLEELARHWLTRHTKHKKSTPTQDASACRFLRDFSTGSASTDAAQKTTSTPYGQRAEQVKECGLEIGTKQKNSKHLCSSYSNDTTPGHDNTTLDHTRFQAATQLQTSQDEQDKLDEIERQMMLPDDD